MSSCIDENMKCACEIGTIDYGDIPRNFDYVNDSINNTAGGVVGEAPKNPAIGSILSLIYHFLFNSEKVQVKKHSREQAESWISKNDYVLYEIKNGVIIYKNDFDMMSPDEIRDLIDGASEEGYRKFLDQLPPADSICQCDPLCIKDLPPYDPAFPPYDPSVLRKMFGDGLRGPLGWAFSFFPNLAAAAEPVRPPKVPTSLGSPLVLDLNGDGVRTVDIEDGVYFDHDGNRFAGKSGWVGAEDALLVRDVDGNGQIDSGKELFGNNTELSNGKNAANGFAALAEFDSNGDGVVDKNDKRWSELKLWQDRNGDGVVDDGELLTLEEAGVAGINVDYKNQNVMDENGNKHLQGGTFIREDGTTGEMNDVWFENDPVDTEYLDDVEVSTEIKKLPNLRGWGEVRDMHQVMATDGGRLWMWMQREDSLVKIA